MARRWSMVPVFIMTPGMVGLTIPAPGPGVSIWVIIPGADGALDMALEPDGSISAAALVMVTGVAAAGAAVAGGDRMFIVLPMCGIAPGIMGIMAVILTGTGTYMSTTITGLISTAEEAESLPVMYGV